MSTPQSDLTVILGAVRKGDSAAAERLLPAVYDELRRLAGHLMAQEKAGHTLQPTALVHEAYMKIVVGGDDWESRRHFFNAAAQAMRRILIDRHRRVNRDRHGGGRQRDDLDSVELPASKEFAESELEHLDEVLDELNSHNERWSEIVHLRYFVGLTIEQTAELNGVSPATVKADWQFARAWLKHRLKQAKA